MILLRDLFNAANAAGLITRDCGRGHYQLKGGSKLVNFYVTAQGSKIFVVGEKKGRFVTSVAQVIEATGVAKQKPAANPAQTLFGDLCAEMADGRVTISLSRDVVSLGCDDREHAMRVFSLLERVADECF